MNDYKNYHSKTLKDNLKDTTGKLFEIQYKTGGEGHEAIIDDSHNTQVIVQNHINPKNELLTDKVMLFLEKDLPHIHWGSIVKTDKLGCPFMVVTEPKTNGMYATCMIRKANNQVKFTLGSGILSYDAVLHIGRIYMEQSYTNDTVVFAEEDKRALIIKYDKNTAQLRMFQELTVDGVVYSVIKVDQSILREVGSEYGVIQIVLLRQAPATLVLNFGNEILGIMRYARLKERVYNSNARELLTLPNVVRTGDYLSYTMQDNEKRTYIVRSMVDEFEDYDRTFMIVCQKEVKFLDTLGQVIIRAVSFSDNRTKLNEYDSHYVVQDTSVVEGYIRLDEKTSQFSHIDDTQSHDYVPKRFIIDNLAYRLVGTDRVTMEGLMTIKLVADRIDPNYDNLELGIADYYRYYPKEESSNALSIQGKKSILVGESSTYSVNDESSLQSVWVLQEAIEGVTLTPVDSKTVTITVKNNVKLTGKIIRLKCTIGTDVLEKSITIVGW